VAERNVPTIVSSPYKLRVRLDCAGSDEFGKRPTDHTRCNNGVMPLICPTCQMVSQDASGSTPALGGYFAWGCFRYFLLAGRGSLRPDLISSCFGG
jgi:hypothetical protein